MKLAVFAVWTVLRHPWACSLILRDYWMGEDR